MSVRSIAHISDLHIGSTPQHSVAAARLCEAINDAGVDDVIVTGDVTEHGRASEFREFKSIFDRLRISGKMIVIPGNHDCREEGVAREMMNGSRTDLVAQEGLSVVRIDTTGWHNRFSFACHGNIDRWILAEVDRLLERIPKNNFVVVALHHHLLRLPEEIFIERLSGWLHLPFANELARGAALLERLKGRCDLVLHGHRHISSETILSHVPRTLRIYNAGSSTALGKFRRFLFQDGKLLAEPVWIQTSVPVND